MLRFEETAPQPAAAAAPLNVVDRFDARAVWSGLDADQRAAIGAAALDLVVAWACKDAVDAESPVYQVPLARAGEGAETMATGDLMFAFGAAVPREQDRTPDGQPVLPASLGMVCRQCGCSQEDGCLDGLGRGCGWAADSLCTACAPGLAAGPDAHA